MVYYWLDTTPYQAAGCEMPTIHIDDDVQRALADNAIKANLDLFSPETPNVVLRSLLGLPELRTGGVVSTNPRSGPGTIDPGALLKAGTVGAVSAVAGGLSRLKIGSRLLREHGLACEKGYFSKTGVPYQKPSAFPAALFDKDGYCVLESAEAMLRISGINVGKQVSIPRGLKSLPGYVSCGHTHG